jgi:hypothetical protein
VSHVVTSIAWLSPDRLPLIRFTDREPNQSPRGRRSLVFDVHEQRESAFEKRSLRRTLRHGVFMLRAAFWRSVTALRCTLVVHGPASFMLDAF